jgi:hypothetical protein
VRHFRLGEEAAQLQLHEADRGVVGADAEDLVARRALAPVERPFRSRFRTLAEHDVDHLTDGASRSMASASPIVRAGRRIRSSNSAPPLILTMLSLLR